MQKISEDLRYLAGFLPHRVARTVEEAEAADYIESRLREILERKRWNQSRLKRPRTRFWFGDPSCWSSWWSR
ncbi:MAG TPA: hypothetical protein PLO53_05860 [Candidatus Hydrogenedentes bacterium]|nr:hypothetical protein [Candidatus Hydrogenedentota bacterium]